MTKPVRIKFKNKATGKTEIVSCHDPATCREHAWLSRAWAGSEKKVIADFHGEATYEDDDNVSVENYMKDSALQELYDEYTIEVRNNNSFVSINPFSYQPKNSEVICQDCGEVLEYRVMRWENESYDGRDEVWVHRDKPELNFFSNPSLNKNLHIATEGEYERHPVGDAHHSKVPSWCRRCGTLDSIVVTREPYMDYIDCSNPECDYHEKYSIGD